MIETQETSVLFVEDNPSDLMIMREHFGNVPGMKFYLHPVERLIEALRFLQEQPCDVILLDLGLPDSQGVETFVRLHAQAPDVPVLVLTGLDDEAVGAKTLQCGAQDYLVKKHVQPELLGKAIRYAMERQRFTDELKLKSKRLQASEARIRAVLGATLDAVFVVDTRGVVRFVNPAGETMFSAKSDVLLANPFPFPLVTGVASEVEVIRHDDENRLAEMRVTESEWDGNLVHLAWLHDITDRKRTQELLLRSEKLQALGTLAGGIAHDFNNILLAVSGNAKLALSDLPEGHSAHDSVMEIARAGSRGVALTKKILGFSRQQPVERRVIQVPPVVEEVLSMLRATLPPRIEIRTDFSPDLPHILADPSQLHRIIVSLVTNAVDAIGDGFGLVEVRACALHLESTGARCSSTLASGDYLMVSVKDNGPGMDMKTMGRVFEPFFTTKPQGRGTGMGLAIVYGIMKEGLGDVTVHTEVGQGTLFNLYFPVTEGASCEIQPDAKAPPLGRGQRILYVDDEAPLVLLIARTLERLGYEVTGFTNPVEALTAFRQNRAGFDAIVTDLSMPKMSGTELAREVLRLRPDLPVVLTTGYILAQDEDEARRIGVHHVILKPDTVEELGDVLHRLLGRPKLQSTIPTMAQ